MHRFYLTLIALLAAISVTGLAADDDSTAPQQPNAQKIPPAFAQLLKGDADNFIKCFDKNKDGFLTKDELPLRLARLFDKVDVNKDGKLDRREVQQMLQILRRRFGIEADRPSKREAVTTPVKPVTPATPPDFDALDLNADGRLTRDELKGTAYEEHFDEIDTNKDGKIDPQEFAAYIRKQAAKEQTRK